MSEADKELTNQPVSEAVEPRDPELVALEEAESKVFGDPEVQQEPDSGSGEQAEEASDTSAEASAEESEAKPGGEAAETDAKVEYDASWAPAEVREQLEAWVESGELDAAKALEAAYKGFQADYTRNKQALKKEVEASQHLIEVGKMVLDTDSGQQWLDKHLKGEDEDFDPSLASKEEFDQYLDRREKRRAKAKPEAAAPEETQAILHEAYEASGVDKDVFAAALNSFEGSLQRKYGDDWLTHLDLSDLSADLEPHIKAVKAEAELERAASKKKQASRAAKAASPSGSRTSEPKYVPPYRAEKRAGKPHELVEATRRRMIEEYGFDPDKLED